MRNHHHILTALALTLLLGVPSPSAATPFADADLETLRDATNQLAAHIEGAILEDTDARDAILSMASSPTRVGAQLTAAMDAAADLGPGVKAMVSGLEVRGTLWWGLAPVWDVELFYWLAGERPAILRMTHTLSRRDLFQAKAVEAEAPLWRAISAMSQALADTIGTGQCENVPRVTPEDYAGVLPNEARAKAKTTSHLNRFRLQIQQECEALSKVPAHGTTWELGEMAIVLKAEDGRQMSLRLQFARGRDGRLTIRRISKPVAPQGPAR